MLRIKNQLKGRKTFIKTSLKPENRNGFPFLEIIPGKSCLLVRKEHWKKIPPSVIEEHMKRNVVMCTAADK